MNEVSAMSKLLHGNDLLTTEEAAKRLGLSSATLCIWRTTKRYPLPYIKVGRMVRYRVEDLNTFLQQQTQNMPKDHVKAY
jgi:excisionase family DNA binding protein